MVSDGITSREDAVKCDSTAELVLHRSTACMRQSRGEVEGWMESERRRG